MKESKYYKPELSEFRIGAEFYLKTSKDNFVHMSVDGPKALNGERLKDSIGSLFIKELDYLDLERLGLIDNCNDGEGNCWYDIPEFGLICLSEYTDHNIEICDRYDEVLFKGKIKNINELKLVLDMIGCEYTDRVKTKTKTTC